ncbi:growth hormone-inducible transmembrane protein-like [Acanthaster planci]|uniref:Growth hormone-inducible transmembrane protein-like n=1 Tax=Acanthaster planci TaxID=133434 RepID=A0A8B7YN29_ACAPL|nr:growth hormone-inducible transmembrane protein-like [Acanthaster planci]XP_022092877.1 growth hormone-inducible transmembrane protein-like [Acanthaster planci]XP_022092878.1 growth hormone-inducible transmembrane protein-like [Acanthaster planci]
MFGSRLLIKLPITACVSASSARGMAICLKPRLSIVVPSKGYASQSRIAAKRATKTKTLKEMAVAPADGSAISIGRGALAGAAAVGIGALCYYGLGLSKDVGALERAAMWPRYVQERVQATYSYFGVGIASTAASALAISRNPAIMAKMMPKSWLGALGMMGVVMCSGFICMSVPYTEGILGGKQLAWLAHSGLLGAVLAPMTLLGGQLLVRAAWYTAGIVGGLSCVAACAPSEKFLYIGGPLAMGLGMVIAASIGGMFFAPTTALGSGLYAISTYGGLILFGGFLLYDTQLIIKRAETHPIMSQRSFDPVNAAMGIYMDTINIFIRIAMILANSSGGRKK